MKHQDSETTRTESAAKPDVCRPTGSADLPMLDVYMPMMKSSAIAAAVRLDLSSALADGHSARRRADKPARKSLACVPWPIF